MLKQQPAASLDAHDAGSEVSFDRMEPGTTAASKAKRRQFTLQQKLDIVREAKAPGVRAAYVARRHGIALNQIYYWRKVYGDLLPDHEDPTLTPDQRQIADLRVQVQKLETLLGQRTFELVLLRERLAALTKSNARK